MHVRREPRTLQTTLEKGSHLEEGRDTEDYSAVSYGLFLHEDWREEGDLLGVWGKDGLRTWEDRRRTVSSAPSEGGPRQGVEDEVKGPSESWETVTSRPNRTTWSPFPDERVIIPSLNTPVRTVHCSIPDPVLWI